MTLRIVTLFVRCGERGTALNKRVSHSLKLQLFFAACSSLLVAGLVFAITFFNGTFLLEKTVYGDAFLHKKSDTVFLNLQSYVNEEQLTFDDIQSINIWCNRGKRIELALYSEDTLIYEYPYAAPSVASDNNDVTSHDHNYEYSLKLSDGTVLRAFLYYNSGNAYYFWMTLFSGFLAFIGFSFSFVLFVRKKIQYITLLKKELDILSGGQLEYQVTVKGEDELGELALGIDQMRKSIVMHQNVEQKMRSANSELITSMSHDLRTPLTSLLAYLEIIDRKKYKDGDHMDDLIHKSIGQTMRIKDMADKLFQYFFVYATEWENVNMESADADQLFLQILDDYSSALENKGFYVENDFSEISSDISINTELLKRVLDNLYSNILKYADPEKTVSFSYTRSENKLLLNIKNTVDAGRENKESTCIGLNTCRKIIEYFKGSFETSENDNIFTVAIELPLLTE